MKKFAIVIFISLGLVISVIADTKAVMGIEQGQVSFKAIDIYIDSDKESLGAYQFELKAVKGKVKIVGVEGGQAEAFRNAPYYDPAALVKGRIIIAALSTENELPKGLCRIARVHLQITGQSEPEYKIKLMAAANSDGKEIAAKITIGQGEQK